MQIIKVNRLIDNISILTNLYKMLYSDEFFQHAYTWSLKQFFWLDPAWKLKELQLDDG